MHVKPAVGLAGAEPLVDRGVARRLRRVAVLVEREALPILVIGVCVVQLLRYLQLELAQDGWLAFAGGQEVVRHGLPQHDTLTVWAHGHRWVDQQWLGQLAFYGLFASGGVKLALLANAALIAGALALGIAAARQAGASPLRAAVVAAACIPVVSFYWQLRVQSLVYPLFVCLLWLLLADSRSPSRRVFLVVPMLLLWANLHGSVVLAAFLVALRALTFAFHEARAGRRPRGWIVRSVALVLAPALCIFASPYGLAVAGYYRSTLFNPALNKYIVEWQSPSFALSTAPFFAVLFASLLLLGRSRSLTAFERLVVILVGAMAIVSIRNVVWFGLAALVVLPRALEEVWPVRAAARRVRLNLVVGFSATVAALVAFALAAARPLPWLARDWPQEASAAVTRAVASHPSVRVFATVPSTVVAPPLLVSVRSSGPRFTFSSVSFTSGAELMRSTGRRRAGRAAADGAASPARTLHESNRRRLEGSRLGLSRACPGPKRGSGDRALLSRRAGRPPPLQERVGQRPAAGPVGRTKRTARASCPTSRRMPRLASLRSALLPGWARTTRGAWRSAASPAGRPCSQSR